MSALGYGPIHEATGVDISPGISRPVSDAVAWAAFVETIRTQQREIDRVLREEHPAGVSRSSRDTKVHHVSCRHAAAQLDRALTWNLDFIAGKIRSDPGVFGFFRESLTVMAPPMPVFFTAAQVPEIAAFRHCKQCWPWPT